MDQAHLADLILKGLGRHAEELKQEGIAMDGRLLRDLAQVLGQEALRQGLDPVLAANLQQAAVELEP